MNSSQTITKWLLVAIITLSVIIRIVAAIYIGDEMINLPGTHDQVSYHNLALRVIAGHGFSFGTDWWPFTAAGAPTAHWSFLYTFFLALIYSIFGPHPLAARIIQAVIVGILHPYLAYLIGRRVFNTSVGLLAAFLTAIYIYFIYYSGTLMTEPFYLSAILVSIYFSIKLTDAVAKDAPKRAWVLMAIYLGVSLGVAVLFRQIILLVIPFIYLWIWFVDRKYNTKAHIWAMLISSVLILLMIIPFTIYNYMRFDRFVLLNTNAGFAFYWANHPIYETHFVPILPPEMGSYQELVPTELWSLDEAHLDQVLLRRGLQFIIDDPGRYILLSLSRIPWYFMFWPAQESSLISNISRVLSFGLYLPLMLYGVVYSLIYRPKRIADFIRTPVALLLGVIFTYSMIHILSWTLIRYRLPVDTLLILFAGLAVWDLIGRLGLRSKKVTELEYIRQL